MQQDTMKALPKVCILEHNHVVGLPSNTCKVYFRQGHYCLGTKIYPFYLVTQTLLNNYLKWDDINTISGTVAKLR